MSSPNKLRKVDGERKKSYFSKPAVKKYLQVGSRGFLVTCNFREKDTIRESYNILNQYSIEAPASEVKDGIADDEADEDISKVLAQEVASAKTHFKHRQFQAIETGAKNCIFVQVPVEINPVELGVKIVKDIAESKKQRTRFLLRLIPVEVVTKANISDIVGAAGKLFDKYFLKEPCTFSIMFNRRFNNTLGRDEVIKELAELINIKNCNNKVDLKNAELSVIVEVVKGLCLLSVLPNYYKWKKYNLVELCAPSKPPAEGEETAAKETPTNEEETPPGEEEQTSAAEEDAQE